MVGGNIGMNEKTKNILLLFLSLVIVVPLYIFLHEGGHALVAVLWRQDNRL